jgi:N-acetylglucosaminyldiphosphoundecaprenol N-acetyl-beta-D-mannosaminyltransferase
LSLSETVGRARRAILEGETLTQVSINALKISLANDDPAFRKALGSFDLAGADGQPVVWAARLLGTPIPGRVNGTDLMYELFDLADRERLRVYLLGAKQAALDSAAAVLRERYPGLTLAGVRHGYFDDDEEAAVVEEVARARADILLVALPSPRKEWFLLEHADELGVRFAMGVGGSIDVLAGVQPRAPVWMQRAGLEWLFRVIRDPRGMWRRYLTTNARFLGLLTRAFYTRRIRLQK